MHLEPFIGHVVEKVFELDGPLPGIIRIEILDEVKSEIVRFGGI